MARKSFISFACPNNRELETLKFTKAVKLARNDVFGYEILGSYMHVSTHVETRCTREICSMVLTPA